MSKPLTLAAAAVLLVTGGVERAVSDGSTGAALLGAGLLVLGAWLTMEILNWRKQHDDH